MRKKEIFQLVVHKPVQFMDHGRASSTLCAGSHGYAIGYIVVKRKNKGDHHEPVHKCNGCV